MNLVLAIEADASQADPLGSLVRTTLGAELVLVPSAYAAIVAMNQHVPDLVLFGRDLPQDQRAKIEAHLRFLTGALPVRTLDIPLLAASGPATRSAFPNPFRRKTHERGSDIVAAFEGQVTDLLATADAERASRPDATQTPAPTTQEKIEGPELDTEVRAAEISLIEAEVEFRLQTELHRVRTDAARVHDAEIARVQAEAAEYHSREMERALALGHDQVAATHEAALADARRLAEEHEHLLAAELSRVQREAEDRLAVAVVELRGQLDREREERAVVVAQVGESRDSAVQNAMHAAEMAKERAREFEAAAEAANAHALELEASTEAATTRTAEVEAEITRVRAEANASCEATIQEALRMDEAATARIREIEAEMARAVAAAAASRDAAVDEALRMSEAVTAEADAVRDTAILEAQQAIEAAVARAQRAEQDSARIVAEATTARDAGILRAEQAEADAARVKAEADASCEATLQEAVHIEEAATARIQDAEAAMARAIADADAARDAAVQEALRIAEAASQRAREAELETAQVKADAAGSRDKAVQEALRATKTATKRTRDVETEFARVKAEAEAARDAAVQDAQRSAEAAAERARVAEQRLAPAVAEARAQVLTDARQTFEARMATALVEAAAQLDAAVARARSDEESRIAAQVARARQEERAKLEASLTRLRDELEQARRVNRESEHQVEDERLDAVEFQKAAAEAAMAADLLRMHAAENQRLEAEPATLRADVQRLDTAASGQPSASRDARSIWSRVPWGLLRWDLVAAVVVLLITLVAAVVYLPRMFRSTTKVSTQLVDTPGAAATGGPSVKTALVAAERAVRRPAQTPANRSNATSQTSDAASGGVLAAFSRLPMDVFADGRRIGTTEDGRIVLPAGAHDVQFVSDRFRYRSTVRLVIRAGQVTSHTVTLPSGYVRVTTIPGAEVWIEGARVGVAPLSPVAVPIGTREVVVKDSTIGERRQSVEVKYGETAELTVTGASSTPPTMPRLAPLSQYRP